MALATNALATEDGQSAITSAIQTLASAIDGNGGRYLDLVDLGTSYTAELKNDIATGKFNIVTVGGYLTINSHVYYIAHLDYWLGTGDTECTTHHAVVVPASSSLVSGKLNNSNTTSGGYLGSDFKTGNNGNTALADIRAIIETDFGAANILSHREYFTNAVTSGKPSGGAWGDSTVDLMNEEMVLGSLILQSTNDGTTVPALYTTSKTQLELFAKRPDLISTRGNWWLRDVVSATVFERITSSGSVSGSGASDSFGIRPAFAIC